ncbi:MAG: hypothetical protein IPP30_14110 [Flavobacterium sp.]|nr:hypothetical protein [Flavobacterium sp.]
MKNVFFLFFLTVLTFSVQAQKNKKAKKLANFTITQSKILKAKGTQLVLKQVISDARCPEGVNCVWGGEAQVLVSVYQNKKWMDEEILTFSSKKVEENKSWLSKTLAIPIAKIKSIRLVPYPKDSIKINPKDYCIRVEIAK